MKNKKLKFFIILTLIIQLLMPSYMLFHHYSLYSAALNQTREFKFRLEYINVYRSGKNELYFDIENIYDYTRDDVAVSVGDDGFARLSVAENKIRNKHWFTSKYYFNMNYMTADEYMYEDGVDVVKLKHTIRTKYSLDIEKDDDFYVTAKVYKGAFIPTAIYIEDEKVITFIHDKQN